MYSIPIHTGRLYPLVILQTTGKYNNVETKHVKFLSSKDPIKGKNKSDYLIAYEMKHVIKSNNVSHCAIYVLNII